MGAARNMDTYANEDAHSDITEASLASHQTSMTVRNARMSNPEEKTTDELSKHILRKMEELIRDKENAEQKDEARALAMIKKVFVARRCICVYEISQMRESVRQIPKTWQGRVWSGKNLNFQVWFVLVSVFLI